NEKSVKAARDATPGGVGIDYRAGDYLDQAGPWDFIVSSQTTHHMTDEQLLTFLKTMEREARMGWLICDLHRLAVSYWGFPLLARRLTVDRVVREGGRLSVAGGFRKADWEACLHQAGVPRALVRIVRGFAPLRCVERVKWGLRRGAAVMPAF